MESQTLLQSSSAEDWRQWKAKGSRRQRVDYWNDVICQAVLDVHMNLPKQDDSLFFGSIHSLNQAGARFVSFRSSSHDVTRTSTQVDRTDNGYLMVSLQCRGRSRLTQCRQDVVLEPGDVGIIDSGLPFDLFFPETVDRRIVMMPKRLLASRIRSIDNWTGPIRIKSDFVLSPIVAQLIQILTERELPLADAYAHRMLESIADYLADSISSEQVALTGDDSSRRTYDLLIQYVAQHVTSPDLSAMSAAIAVGVSLRTLHRLFKRFGQTTFEQFVIGKRLVLARQSLMTGVTTSVSEAAFSSGFNDLSHFTRRFFAAFGVNPSSLLLRR